MSEPKRYKVIGNDGPVRYVDGDVVPLHHYFDHGDIVQLESEDPDMLTVVRNSDGRKQIVARVDLEELS